LPGGSVTFVFTDIEGSTRLLKALRHQYGQLLAEHRDLVRAAIAAHGGHEVDTQGDAFFAAFAGAKQAVLCALAVQRALAAHEWPAGARVRVRMGIHTGQAVPAGSGYTGLAVHRAARICAVAGGGQVLISQATQAIIEDEEEGEGLGFALADVGEYRLKDLDRPVRLFALAADGLDPPARPAKGRRVPAPPRELAVHGWPAALTSFVGRAAQVDEVAGLLQERRLVTVTGPGGMGKTRLAGEVARRVADRFADGVWLVELAPVQDPALVPAAVAAALGAAELAGEPVADSLAGVLAGWQLLLVLDNCEHVIDAAAKLCGKLLAACDDMRILATSREPLAVAGEARYRLPPLALAGDHSVAGKRGTAAAAGESEAVALLADRARQADPHFTVTKQTRPLAERLVARLDGMPLAIELAAARVESLGLAELLANLDDRLELLTGGDRRAAPRLRSLAAAVDWSYRLLSHDGQAVFRRLAVIPGPFTLDAAAAVAGPGAKAVVLHLVDCSLLTPPRPGPDGRARYLMLETLRAFGLDRLAGTGEAPQTAAALARYARQVADQAGPAMQTGAGELAAARLLDAEEAAVQQGLAWTMDHDPAAALHLALALTPWWSLRGRLTPGYDQLYAAADQVAPGGDEWCTAQLQLGLGAFVAGNSEVALGHHTAAYSALADRGPTPALVWALWIKFAALLTLDRIPEAVEAASSAQAAAQQTGDQAAEAMAAFCLGVITFGDGDIEGGLSWSRRACQADPAAVPGWVTRMCRWMLAVQLFEAGDPAARQAAEDALAQFREAGHVYFQGSVLITIALIDLRAGRLAEAGAHLEEAIEIASRISDTMHLIECLDACGHLCATTGDWADAVTVWAAHEACHRQAGLSTPPHAEGRRAGPLRRAREAVGPARAQAAAERGAAMTLATAAEFAAMLTAAGSRQPRELRRAGQLSAREQELVTMVARGLTDTQIAGELHLSVRAVRSRLDRIRGKTGYRRRADLTRLALQESLV
jgi:predicted ATPase/class 3 adenylate cyclase/DNA-binding CsgD family transcriptional regulator